MEGPAKHVVPLCRPDICAEEVEAVVAVLTSGWLAHGPKNALLEEEFRKLTGARHAVAMNSCTSALHLAIEAQGIRGEVLVPSFTWVASVNAILTAGAQPVLVDIEPRSRCVDPAALEAALSSRTEAIMVVHYGGQMAAMDSIAALCKRHSLALIEDTAETIGATYHGRPQGSFGTACFSFFPTKNITTGEGGMLTTDDDEIHRRVRALVGHGLESTTYEREKAEKPWLRAATFAGYNFRLSNILAALGVVQIRRLEEMNAARRRIAARYLEALAGDPRLELPEILDGRTHAWQMFTALTSDIDRTEFLRALRSVGVGASVHFDPPVHRQPRHGEHRIGPGGLTCTERVAQSIVTLPMFPAMRDVDIEHVISAVRWALEISTIRP